MSVGGMLRVRGSRCTVKRPADVANADGTTSKVLTTQATVVPVLMVPVSQARVKREWGEEVQAEYLGLAEASSGIQQHDALVITRGKYSGQTFVVKMIQPGETLQGVAHIHLWCVSTGQVY